MRKSLGERPRFRAAIALVSGNSLGALAALCATLIAARFLSIDEFAVFGVALAVNSLCVQLSELGVGVIVVAELSESRDPADTDRKLRKLLEYRIGSAAVIAAGSVAVIMLVPELDPYRASAIAGALGGIGGTLAFFSIGGLQGLQQFKLAGSLQMTQGLLRLVLVTACVLLGFTSFASSVSYTVGAPLVVAGLGLGLMLKLRRQGLFGQAGKRGRAPDIGANRLNRERQRTLAASGVLAALTLNLGVLILAGFGSPAQVAEYSGAWRIAAGVLLINTALAATLLPFIMRASDVWSEAKKLLFIGVGTTTAWLLSSPLLFFAGPAVLGGELSETVQLPLAILLVAFSLDSIHVAVYQVYLRVGRSQMILVMGAIQFLVMTTVTLVLIHYGASAPAWGQLAARLAVIPVVLAPIWLYAKGMINWFRSE